MLDDGEILISTVPSTPVPPGHGKGMGKGSGALSVPRLSGSMSAHGADDLITRIKNIQSIEFGRSCEPIFSVFKVKATLVIFQVSIGSHRGIFRLIRKN